MSVEVKKDKKGPCWEVGRKRAGYWEGIFLTMSEIAELARALDEILK